MSDLGLQGGLHLLGDPAAPLLYHCLRGLALLERLGLKRNLPRKQVQRQRGGTRHRHQHETDPHGCAREFQNIFLPGSENGLLKYRAEAQVPAEYFGDIFSTPEIV